MDTPVCKHIIVYIGDNNTSHSRELQFTKHDSDKYTFSADIFDNAETYKKSYINPNDGYSFNFCVKNINLSPPFFYLEWLFSDKTRYERCCI